MATIERELTALWKKVGEEGDDSGVIRACLLNLIIYSPGADKSAKLDDIITEVTAAHPCRAIVLLADREAAEATMAAEVTSRCTLPTANSKQVCCEEVTITARGAQVNEAPSAVASLLLADLPVYLWWRAVPRLSDRVFRRLTDLADRVVIDSADFADQQGDLIDLAASLRESPRWTAFSDLNWARLTTWRALLASFYDVAEYRPLLDRMSQVMIEYSPLAQDGNAIPARAMLLAGWLASRLGWKLETATRSDRTTAFALTTAGGKVTIEFVPTSRQIEPGHLALVKLTSAADGAAAFNVRRSGDGQRIETSVTLGEERHIQRVLGYEGWSESALIGRELEILGHDRVYEQAILASGELAGALVKS